MAAEDKSDFETFDRWLLLLDLTPPVAWFSHLSISYTLVPQSCLWSSKTLLHLLTVVGISVTIACAWLSLRALRRLGPHEPMSAPHEQRRRFMALMGVVFGILFTTLIVANQIPNFLLRSCD